MSHNAPVAPTVEAWMLDVGAGTSNIIRLGFGHAIVIDCGPKDSFVPLAMLQQERIHTIDALIVSHNHSDHDGGAARILAAYPRAIKRTYFIHDGHAGVSRFFDLAMQEWKDGRLLRKPLRLEAREDAYAIYPWPEDAADRVKLPDDFQMVLLHPTFHAAVDAEAAEQRRQGRSNRQSGVLLLGWGSGQLIFPGDASIEAWEAIADDYDVPFHCDVIAAPHHGGHITSQRRGESRRHYEVRRQADIRRLYGDFVRPKHVVFSVSSSQQYSGVHHPLPESVDAVRETGATVACTQMTPQCCNDLEAVRPGLVRLITPSRSSAKPQQTKAGASRDVGCMGTVVVSISAAGADVHQLDKHRHAVDALDSRPDGCPLCRRTVLNSLPPFDDAPSDDASAEAESQS